MYCTVEYCSYWWSGRGSWVSDGGDPDDHAIAIARPAPLHNTLIVAHALSLSPQQRHGLRPRREPEGDAQPQERRGGGGSPTEGYRPTRTEHTEHGVA